MSAPSILMRVLHLAQAALSAYGTYHSYHAITNLQNYEEATKKLAKWSDEVGHQLNKTRKTQAAAALTILTSLLASTTLLFYSSALPTWARYGSSPTLVIVIYLARSYVSDFWAPSDGKNVGVRIPLPKAGEYNAAQAATEQVIQTMQFLEYSWVGTAFVAGMLGYA